MNNNQDFNELKKALHMLAHALIQDGIENKDHAKWFLGNSLGAILVASEDNEDILKLSEIFKNFCDGKRKELEEMEDLAKKVDEMPIQNIPGITDLLTGTGVCLN